MPPVFAVYRCVQMDVCSFVAFKFPCHDFVVVVQIHGTEIRVFKIFINLEKIVNVSADKEYLLRAIEFTCIFLKGSI